MNWALNRLLEKSAKTAAPKIDPSTYQMTDQDLALHFARVAHNKHIRTGNPWFENTNPESFNMGKVPTWALGAGMGSLGGGLVGYGLGAWRRNREVEELMKKGMPREQAEIVAARSPVRDAALGATIGGVGAGIGLPWAYMDSADSIKRVAANTARGSFGAADYKDIYKSYMQHAIDKGVSNDVAQQLVTGLDQLDDPALMEAQTLSTDLLREKGKYLTSKDKKTFLDFKNDHFNKWKWQDQYPTAKATNP